jgi:hypothetical protein
LKAATLKTPVTKLDVIFLSFDEPNCEHNWSKLLDVCPWAKRVHGVRGFDAAHKAAAYKSNTPRFITVDGDNIVDQKFFELELDIPKESDFVYSCNAVNNINGLAYGNGGLKVWTKEFVLSMKTHEAATNETEKTDFCWSTRYCQLNNVYSTTVVNSTPDQAFRAGFREGVKMLLDRGLLVEPSMVKDSHPLNLERLLVWATVGQDVKNGLYACAGARVALNDLYVTQNLDHTKVSDYEWLNNFISNRLPQVDEDYVNELGKTITKELGIPVPPVLCGEASLWYKRVAAKTRVAKNPMMTELELESLWH